MLNFGFALPTGSENIFFVFRKLCHPYLKLGRGDPCAGQSKLTAEVWSAFAEERSEVEGNFGPALPMGSTQR